jgi:hypothetical protein
MTKPAAPRSANITQTPPAGAGGAPAPAPTAAPDAPKTAGISWGWRVALFLWATAFICLLAYELLNTLVRSLSRMF